MFSYIYIINPTSDIPKYINSFYMIIQWMKKLKNHNPCKANENFEKTILNCGYYEKSKHFYISDHVLISEEAICF